MKQFYWIQSTFQEQNAPMNARLGQKLVMWWMPPYVTTKNEWKLCLGN